MTFRIIACHILMFAAGFAAVHYASKDDYARAAFWMGFCNLFFLMGHVPERI